jgi:hypothetical protein
VFFGHPESLKSFTALLVAICVQLPWRNNPFGWRVPDEPQNCLYLTTKPPRQGSTRDCGCSLRGHFGDMHCPLSTCQVP